MKAEYSGDWRATLHKQMLGRVGQLGNDTPERLSVAGRDVMFLFLSLSVTQGCM